MGFAKLIKKTVINIEDCSGIQSEFLFLEHGDKLLPVNQLNPRMNPHRFGFGRGAERAGCDQKSLISSSTCGPA